VEAGAFVGKANDRFDAWTREAFAARDSGQGLRQFVWRCYFRDDALGTDVEPRLSKGSTGICRDDDDPDVRSAATNSSRGLESIKTRH
jgi:hypothetical protein